MTRRPQPWLIRCTGFAGTWFAAATPCAITSVAAAFVWSKCAINLDAVVERKGNALGACLNAAVEPLRSNQNETSLFLAHLLGKFLVSPFGSSH